MSGVAKYATHGPLGVLSTLVIFSASSAGKSWDLTSSTVLTLVPDMKMPLEGSCAPGDCCTPACLGVSDDLGASEAAAGVPLLCALFGGKLVTGAVVPLAVRAAAAGVDGVPCLGSC